MIETEEEKENEGADDKRWILQNRQNNKRKVVSHDTNSKNAMELNQQEQDKNSNNNNNSN